MRTLLVSPGFHGYWRSIARAVEAQGHECLVHVYDCHPGLAGKVHDRAAAEIPGALGTHLSRLARARTTRAATDAVRQSAPQRVLVVKGDTLGAEFWETLDALKVPRVVWLYDEVRRTEYEPAQLARLTPVATYSRQDADLLLASGASAAYLPLAFDDHSSRRIPGPRTDSVVFVGARYPQREDMLLALQSRGVDVRVFGRDWSHHIADRIRTGSFRRPSLPAGRNLSRPDAYRVMARATATLNIHGDQDGFTMRTFEAAGVGAVQLIDRASVAEFYEPGREVLPFADLDELGDLCERVRRNPGWAQRIRAAARRRTLAEHTFKRRLRALEELWD